MMHFYATSLLQAWKLVCENLKVWDLGWIGGLGVPMARDFGQG